MDIKIDMEVYERKIYYQKFKALVEKSTSKP